MNYHAKNPAIFRRTRAARALTAGTLACTLAVLLSTAAPSAAAADPAATTLPRVAARTAMPQASPRAAQARRTCADASGDVAIKACNDAIASGQHQGQALAEIYYNRAIEYDKKGDEQRALADYSEALRIM